MVESLRGYLVCTPLALILLSDEGKVLAKEYLPDDPEKAAEAILQLEEGGIPASLTHLLNKIIKIDELVVEDSILAEQIASVFKKTVLVKTDNEIARTFRENLPKYLEILEIDHSQFINRVYEISLHLTRRKVRKAAEKRDLFIAQAISALDDVNKTLNLFASRVREWYSLHFPELDELLEDHEDYIKVVSKIGGRDSISQDRLREIGIKEEMIEKIESAAKSSMGADITDFDLSAIRLLSDITLELFEARRGLEKYIDEAMMEVAPNVRGIVGPLLGARLIALAGGLSKLSTLPASTIQVLGAEKALFRALKTGGRPPKHGVIFQHTVIHKSPKWQRGKIARALAAKLAIAARIDAFSGEYKADEIREQLEQRIQEIKTLYAKPPPKRQVPPPREKREKGKSRRRGGR